MAHFTYSNTQDVNTLHQGDLLKKTDRLKEVIEEVHPYFLRDDYEYFIVLTQSCDLVIRDNQESSKSQYINIAVVRTLDSILSRESRKYIKDELEERIGIIDNKKKQLFNRFLTKLLNNNDPNYFYLHEDINIGLQQPYVACIRVNIALKSQIHYDTCLSAKILELKPEFQAKLGWLTGNLFSRVGTKDWVPDIMDHKKFNKYINELLDSKYIFVERLKDYKDLLTKSFGEDIDRLTQDEILEFLSKNELPSHKDRFINRLENLIYESEFVAENDIKKLINRIRNDKDLARYIK